MFYSQNIREGSGLSFNSLTFIFLFFPLFFSIYYLAQGRLKNSWAILGSLFFYSWGSPIIIFNLLFICFIDYYISKGVRKFSSHKNVIKIFITVSICTNVCLLGYFKYQNFFINEVNRIISFFGIVPIPLSTILLPVGLSFLTFKKISYIVDVYRGKTAPAATFSDFLLYVMLFPQIMAGPIVRYHEISDQIKYRKHSLELFFNGMVRFSLGLGKKVLIADILGEIANKIFAMPPESLPVAYAWLGIVCFTFQIYFDFSGYSDMAIGIGNMMGFTCPENFNMPYISQTVTEFWRRWHITLSSWMREYLYIPLGGNRVSSYRMYSNLWIVFLLSGLWHGANWTFVIWGAYYGFFLTIDKLFWHNISLKINKTLNIAITFLIILFGWVLFRSPDLTFAINYYMRMLGFLHYSASHPPIIWQELVSNRAIFILFVALFISFFPALNLFDRMHFQLRNSSSDFIISGIKFVLVMVISFLAIVSISNTNFNAFIYFRF